MIGLGLLILPIIAVRRLGLRLPISLPFDRRCQSHPGALCSAAPKSITVNVVLEIGSLSKGFRQRNVADSRQIAECHISNPLIRI